jgi:hypothetical protein
VYEFNLFATNMYDAVDYSYIKIKATFPSRVNFAAIFQNSHPEIKENKDV